MIPYFKSPHPLLINKLVVLPWGECYGHLDSGISLRLASLHVSTASPSIIAHIIDIDRRANDFYIVEGELRALCNNSTVDCNQGGPIVVQAVTITALLIGIKVDTSQLTESRQLSSQAFIRGIPLL